MRFVVIISLRGAAASAASPTGGPADGLLTACARPDDATQAVLPSQSGRGWLDDEAFLGWMRVRGVQCRARYAEAFTAEKAVLDPGSDYSVN